MERSGKRYSGKPDGGAKRRRNAQIEEFRVRGNRGAEGLEGQRE